jgi:hypothetical protein
MLTFSIVFFTNMFIFCVYLFCQKVFEMLPLSTVLFIICFLVLRCEKAHSCLLGACLYRWSATLCHKSNDDLDFIIDIDASTKKKASTIWFRLINLGSYERGAQGSAYIRLLRNNYFCIKLVFKCAYHSDISRHAAGHHELSFKVTASA